MSQSQVRDISNSLSSMNVTDSKGDTRPSDPFLIETPWKDITSFLDDAVQEMKEGQLVHLQSFTLFDAMSAIEIMDPRMDTGMIIEQENKGKEFDIDQHLTPSELLWIMDRLLACEMSWLSGHSLAQTVYTCVYFHHVPELMKKTYSLTATDDLNQGIQLVLKAAILGSAKCCHHILSEMVAGNVFEEEDFTTNLFGLSLYDDIPDMDVLNDIDASLRLLTPYLKTDDSKVLSALYERLELRKLFLLSLIYLAQPQCSHINEAQASLSKITALLDTSSIVDALDLGKQVDGAFDPNINRKLTSQAPPRTATLHTHQQAYRDFALTVKRLESICTVTSFSSVASLITYFDSFASSQPYPDAFSRSKLNSLFYSDGGIFGSYPITSLIIGSIFDIVQPPSHWFQFDQPGDPETLSTAKASLHRFLDQNLSLPFVDFFKIQCHNRARQRRILCKVLGEWEMLQEEAIRIDTLFQEAEGLEDTYYFSIWAYTIKMKMMEQILLLGFELELYGESEYTTIYWYHWYLQSVLERRVEYQQQKDEDAKEKGKGEGKEIGKAKAAEAKSEELTYSVYMNKLNVAKKDMSIGMFKLLLAAKKTNQWKEPWLRFDNPETRFDHRLKPFASLSSPPPQGYQQFLQDSATDHLDAATLFQAAAADFTSAKKMLELLVKQPVSISRTELCRDASKKVLLSMVKTCVANNISILQLLKTVDEGKSTNVTLSFKYHPWWPIMLMQE